MGIILNLSFGTGLNNDLNASIVKTNTLNTMMFQTANVPCKDVQEFGSGYKTERICADGTTALCDWKKYEDPANNGTCTLSSEVPEDPEMN